MGQIQWDWVLQRSRQVGFNHESACRLRQIIYLLWWHIMFTFEWSFACRSSAWIYLWSLILSTTTHYCAGSSQNYKSSKHHYDGSAPTTPTDPSSFTLACCHWQLLRCRCVLQLVCSDFLSNAINTCFVFKSSLLKMSSLLIADDFVRYLTAKVGSIWVTTS